MGRGSGLFYKIQEGIGKLEGEKDVLSLGKGGKD